MAQKQKILAADGTVTPFEGTGMWMVVTIEAHAGGTWTLQCRSEESVVWNDIDDIEFDGNDYVAFMSVPGMLYRLNGGALGAIGYAHLTRFDYGSLG